MKVPNLALWISVGLGLAGLALAQQPGERPTSGAALKAQLRSRVIKLRAEVDVLQVDHDAERESLVAWLKTFKQPEYMGAVQPGVPTQLGMMMVETNLFTGKTTDAKEWEELANKYAGNEKGFLNAVAEKAKKQEETVRTSVARKRADYAHQAAELAEKRLDLEDLETQYRKAP